MSIKEATHLMASREVELVDFLIRWLFGEQAFFRLVRVLPRATMGFYFEVIEMLGLGLGISPEKRQSMLDIRDGNELAFFEDVPPFLNRFCAMVYYSKELKGQVWLLLLAKSKKLQVMHKHLFG